MNLGYRKQKLETQRLFDCEKLKEPALMTAGFFVLGFISPDFFVIGDNLVRSRQLFFSKLGTYDTGSNSCHSSGNPA